MGKNYYKILNKAYVFVRLWYELGHEASVIIELYTFKISNEHKLLFERPDDQIVAVLLLHDGAQV